MQGLQVVLHPPERRAGGVLQRRVDSGNGFDQSGHFGVDGERGVGKRLFDGLGDLRLEQIVQRRFVLGLQALERHVVLGQEPHRR